LVPAGAALLLALLVPSAVARNTYVANQGGGVSVIDIATNQAIEVPDGNKLIKAGAFPFGIAISPDGKRAYVANQGSESVSVIDTATNQAIEVPDGNKQIKAGDHPTAIAISPDGRRAYVANARGGVTVIDIATNQAIEVPDGNKLIKVGTEPTAIAISPDGRRAYVTNFGGGVSVIDTTTNQVIEVPDGNKLIKVGIHPFGITISPDGRHAYVANEGGGVSVIDTATNQAIEVPDGGKLIKDGAGPVGIAISPDGRRAYVANLGGDVSVIDTTTNQAIEVPDGNKLIKAGTRSFGIAISPDGRRAYVANEGGGVSVIDTTTNQAIEVPDGGKLIKTGIAPIAVAITPDQSPLASFSVQPTRARPGVPVSLDASASKDPDGSIAAFSWNFGDNQSASLTTPKALHTYAKPGTYTTTLTATDNEGCSASLIFTGQTASCAGSSLATTTATVKVAYPGVKVRCPKSAKPKGCSFKLQVLGSKPKKGKKAKPESAVAKAKVKAGHAAIVSLKPTTAFAAKLAAANKILVRETVIANDSTRTRLAKLKIVQ
jgi:YVTN family beta-propeller protein